MFPAVRGRTMSGTCPSVATFASRDTVDALCVGVLRMEFCGVLLAGGGAQEQRPRRGRF